jgi:adenylylsulfate kinase
MVIWIVGLAGSGKTVIGRELCKLLKNSYSNTVFVDGDDIRSIFKHDRSEGDYSLESRKKNAERICEICAWLDKQGVNVVCSVLSIFEESRRWNRRTYSEYFEVFINVSMEVLKARDQKGLYSGAAAGNIKNVVGFDIQFEVPESPDMVIDNNMKTDNFSGFAKKIYEKCRVCLENSGNEGKR